MWKEIEARSFEEIFTDVPERRRRSQSRKENEPEEIDAMKENEKAFRAFLTKVIPPPKALLVLQSASFALETDLKQDFIRKLIRDPEKARAWLTKHRLLTKDPELYLSRGYLEVREETELGLRRKGISLRHKR